MEGEADKSVIRARAAEIDKSAFGVIYGTITVLSLLMALPTPVENSLRTAIVLFASVFAVALAKAYAEVCDEVLEKARPAALNDLKSAWIHSRTVLLAANMPAACFLLAFIGIISSDLAYSAAQITALATIVFFGGRIGWKIRNSVWSAIAGAGITAIIGLVISSMKFLAH